MIENLEQNQIIFIIILMAVSAIPVGFMAGLFGIGGGLITVPVLFYIFNSIDLDQAFIMHLAVGTSFSIIIPTSIISTMTHMKYKAVDLKIVKTFGLFEKSHKSSTLRVNFFPKTPPGNILLTASFKASPGFLS